MTERAARGHRAAEQAAQGLEEIANLASSAERSCYYHHDQFLVGEDEHLSPEPVNLELDRLRDVIRRLGWMADVCYTRLTGAAGVRSAEEWFFSPMFNKMSEGAGNGRPSWGVCRGHLAVAEVARSSGRDGPPV